MKSRPAIFKKMMFYSMSTDHVTPDGRTSVKLAGFEGFLYFGLYSCATGA